MKSDYFFLHLGKCAGTTIRTLLAQQTPFYHVINTSTELSLRAEHYYRTYAGVGGHFRLRDANPLGFDQAWRFTFMRDPIERLISHLTFATLREPPVYDLDYFPPNLDALKAHLAADLLCPTTSFHNSYIFFLSTADERAPVEEHTQSSIANLRPFEFIGFQDNLDADVTKLFSLLGLQPPGTIPRENAGPARTRALKEEMLADRECVELLQECTKSDREIYAAARGWRAGPPAPRATLDLGAARRTLPAEIKSPRLHVVECSLASPSVLAPGATLEVDILLEAAGSEPGFHLTVSVENPLESRALLQIFSYNELQQLLGNAGGMTLVRLAVPCWLNEGGYVGHLKAYSLRRELLVEKPRAFSFQVLHPGCAPRQAGVLYTEAQLTAQEVTHTRRLSLDDARKLTLTLDGGLQFGADRKTCAIPLLLENTSAVTISSAAGCRCFVSHHQLNQTREVVLYDSPRHPLPSLPPGSVHHFLLRVEFTNPDAIKFLQIRILQENVRWHEGVDFAQVILPDIRLV